MQRWYAVQSKPREEQRAEAHLGNQGYEVFHPRARLRRRSGGRVRTVTESLFPRYLFIRLDDTAQNWAPIRSTRGVAGLVRFGGQPLAVPESVIEALTARLDPETGAVDLTATAGLRPNQRVRITEGPFAGHEALFQTRRGEDRVVVLLEIMHKAQRITLPESAVR